MAYEADGDRFDTTRGKLLLQLGRSARTVNELAAALGVTDNAVRAHLASLQSAGLVRPVGLRPGVRRPHVDYELTPKARGLFPRAHEPVLGALVGVLRERLGPDELTAVLKQTAHRLLDAWVADLNAPHPRGRLTEFAQRLATLTAGLRLEETRDHVTVSACGCPLASVTAAHPELCGVLAEVLSELLGADVRACCDRDESPRCRFEVMDGGGTSGS